MPVVLTGLSGPTQTASRRRAGSFDSSVLDSSRINISLPDSEATTPSPSQPSFSGESLSQDMRERSTECFIPPASGLNIEVVTGSSPLTALELLTRPFPIELFDGILNGRDRSSRSSSISVPSWQPSRHQRARDKALSSGGKSESEPNPQSEPDAVGGDYQHNEVIQPVTVSPSRFPRLPPAVTRDVLGPDDEDRPTSFLSHVDELKVIRQRRSAIAEAASTSPYHRLRRTEKSSDLREHLTPVCRKTVRFFLGHLPTGTVPSITITPVPDEETHILLRTSETDRSLLSVNEKLRDTSIRQRNAERKAERLLVVQKRAGRIYNWALRSNGGDGKKAKVMAEKWLNRQETRMFVAGWIQDSNRSIHSSPGAWRDVDETQEYARKCEPAICGRRVCGKSCKNPGYILFRPPQSHEQQDQKPSSSTAASTIPRKRLLFGYGSKPQQQRDASPATGTTCSRPSKIVPMEKNRKRDLVRHTAHKVKNVVYESCRGYTKWRSMELSPGEGRAYI